MQEIVWSPDSDSPGDLLQATLKTSVVTGPSQINMRTRQIGNMKSIQQFGHVKGTAVEGHQQPDIIQQIQKIIQVFVFDKSVQLIPVPADDHRDLIVET